MKVFNIFVLSLVVFLVGCASPYKPTEGMLSHKASLSVHSARQVLEEKINLRNIDSYEGGLCSISVLGENAHKSRIGFDTKVTVADDRIVVANLYAHAEKTSDKEGRDLAVVIDNYEPNYFVGKRDLDTNIEKAMEAGRSITYFNKMKRDMTIPFDQITKILIADRKQAALCRSINTDYMVQVFIGGLNWFALELKKEEIDEFLAATEIVMPGKKIVAGIGFQ